MNEQLMIAKLNQVPIQPGEYGVVVHIDRNKKVLTQNGEVTGDFVSAGVTYTENISRNGQSNASQETHVALSPHLIQLPTEANGKLSSQFLTDVIHAQAGEPAGILAIAYRGCINETRSPDAEIQQAVPIASILAQALQFEEAQGITSEQQKQEQVQRILNLVSLLFPTISETICGYHDRGDNVDENTQWSNYFVTQGRNELEATGGVRQPRILKPDEQSHTLLIASHSFEGLPLPQAISSQVKHMITPSTQQNHLASEAYRQNVDQPAKNAQHSVDYYLSRLFQFLDMPLGLESLHAITGVGKGNQFVVEKSLSVPNKIVRLK